MLRSVHARFVHALRRRANTVAWSAQPWKRRQTSIATVGTPGAKVTRTIAPHQNSFFHLESEMEAW